jgi:flagellar hook-associated protein FlgK
MSGIYSTLSIAKTAIAAQQYGLSITGQNVANVNNEDYSVQYANQVSMKPAPYAGFIFGTGVDLSEIKQSVDALLEGRLTEEYASQAYFEEQESYMRVLEGFFDESSDSSLASVLTEFWNTWHDMSDNPQGSSERVAVFESGNKLAERFESVLLDMDSLLTDISNDIIAAVGQINELTTKIADLNKEILSVGVGSSANDLKDQRTALVKDLSSLITINSFEQSNGSLTINVANAYTIVNGVDSYRLGVFDREVVWYNSEGGTQTISNDIEGGKVGGLLEMRDSVIPKYQAEINELAREMIWAINYQHSQGAGLEYFKEPVTGNYQADDGGWLTSLDFGDKIDFNQDFTMWVEDSTDAATEYRKILMDMGISEASVSNWQGTAPGAVQSIYKLTVVDEAFLGDMEVTEFDGDGLASVQVSGSTAGASVALNQAIAAQTISVYNGPGGTSVINVKDVGGDAKRSAASIAAALSEVDGVSASASETSASIRLTDNLGVNSLPDTEDGDQVQFTIYVDGILQQQSFIVDSSQGTLQEQFEDSLLEAAEAINLIHEDADLYANGLTLTSESGRTLGIQDFEVQDNSGIRLSSFTNFDEGDQVSFTIDSITAPIPSTAAATTTTVTVDLGGVDTTDEAAMSQAFSSALTDALDGRPFTIQHDPSTNSIVVRTTDGSGIRMGHASGDTGDDAVIDIALEGGSATTSAAANTELRFNNVLDASDSVRYEAVSLSTDEIYFVADGVGAAIAEASAGGGNKNAVVTGTVTATLESGMVLGTNVSGAGSGGVFSSTQSKRGSSILTFGGEGGFSGFSSAGGETISFDLDGTTVAFNTTAGTGTSDLAMAQLLEAEIIADLTLAGVIADYQVIRTGSSVSVIKDAALEDPIRVENFADSLGNNARIKMRTGTGTGTNQPDNDVLDADPSKINRNSVTSSLYDDEGVILWERLDGDGIRSGASGLISVEDAGQVSIVENGSTTLTFDISEGSLVAGNTMTVNTDTTGVPDPLDFTITGRANAINTLYQFEVISGGKVGELPGDGEEDLEIRWSNGLASGTFTIEGHDPPYTPLVPVEVKVDGMNFKFYDGTVFSGDVFTVTTGETGIPQSLNADGKPTGETMSNWHWTMDSFADEFNRQGAGLTASVTLDNRMEFGASERFYTIDNTEYSGNSGFSEDNVTLTVTDWSAMDFGARDLRFERSGNGRWGVLNDPTGGTLQLIPAGGDDDGFGVDFTGDGIVDMRIDFAEQVTGNGYVELDLVERSTQDIGFAFSDDNSSDAGLAAALGINTFFDGLDAMTMAVNSELSDTKFIAAAKIDSETGEISAGDNANALFMADVQYTDVTLKLWTYERGSDAVSSTTTASLDDYYNTIISSLGIDSQSIKNSKSFSDTMVNSIKEQRDSVSAVSLDEEMIRLIKYQHAFSAASKLLTVSDEMLNTLISIR